MICWVISSVEVTRPCMASDQPSMLPSEAFMKLSSVTKLVAMRWKFGVIALPNWVSAGSAIGAVGQVAENLVEGAVFLDDVDHVLDLRAQEHKLRRVVKVRLRRVEVVRRHLGGQRVQFGRPAAPAR